MPDIPKDWCLNMAKLEDGQEIGAGSPDHPLRGGSMRDYLEQRERDLEKRIAGLEALLCDAQQDIEQFKCVLGMVHITLVAHGRVDAGTDLHKRIMKALEFSADTISKLNN